MIKRRFSNIVKIVEVGPRDGLQNEKTIIPTSTKISLVNKLSQTGLHSIEVTSFVSPKWIPQLADGAAVLQGINKQANISYPVLVPNVKGLKSAMDAGAKEIAIFAAATESFTQRNLNCSIQESLDRFKDVCQIASSRKILIRGYVSVVLGCPYQGAVKTSQVLSVVKEMKKLGCYEISLGDTIGVGTPKHVQELLKALTTEVPIQELALHCHDTFGMAIANIYQALQMGVRVFDSSVAGLGGCPYANGATGNVATEDLVYLLRGLGLDSGVDLDKLVNAGSWISKELNRQNGSKAALAILSKK